MEKKLSAKAYEERLSKRIRRYRDGMQYEQGYLSTAQAKASVDARIYCTRRSGTYGYQFACIIWYKGTAFAGDISSGCGYDKVGYAVASALREMRDHGQWYESAKTEFDNAIAHANSGSVREAMAIVCSGFAPMPKMIQYPGCIDWDAVNKIMVYAHG